MSEENKSQENSERLNAAMVLVRCGWQMACEELLHWCADKKVSEQFTNQIIEMMDFKKKRPFDWVKLRKEMEAMGLRPKENN